MNHGTLHNYTNGIIVGMSKCVASGTDLATKMTSEIGCTWEWYTGAVADLPEGYAVSCPVKVGGMWGRLIIR